jgi:hypothetical protein
MRRVRAFANLGSALSHLRDNVISMLKAVLLASLAVLALARAAPAEPIDPAQAIAQKFSEASDAKPAAAPARPSLDYEMDMLRRARAEELEHQKQDTPKPPMKMAQPAATMAAEPVATAPPPVPAPALSPPPEPVAHIAVPEASEPPAVAKPAAAAITPAPVAKPSTPEAKPSEPVDDSGVAAAGAPRATVLVVLDTNDNDAAPVKPDPIICFDQQCWVSGGLDAPARPIARTAALALKSTDTVTNDSCGGKSACAFRDVALPANAPIEVVEVGESRGVADGSYTVAADKSCRKDGGDLVCGNALVTHAFRMWVVPEATAQEIGASKLEDAVAAGLPGDDAQSANDK